jgi:hypothetical protein
VEAAGGSGLPGVRGLTARRTIGLALIRPERRTAAETRALGQVVALGPEIATLIHLLEQFAWLIRRQGSDPIGELASWKHAAVATGWEELGTFVARLQQDQAAVEAALLLPYSQGHESDATPHMSRSGEVLDPSVRLPDDTAPSRLSLSADGKLVAYSAFGSDANEWVWVASINGGSPRRLARGADPDWRPTNSN